MREAMQKVVYCIYRCKKPSAKFKNKVRHTRRQDGFHEKEVFTLLATGA